MRLKERKKYGMNQARKQLERAIKKAKENKVVR
jgi:hypothetical protein